ncbi:hypothetical protein SCLCIDRAFT_1159472 [Scleroderma citrinum Foug A]|uniref:Uncharacterized protein n=1 Tax=Scleroderma citrinum Foug A TaxID=1036808 RepID=A0A0C3D9B8_9AGAM|nr:hypothetical protein SCLCIDRAFT_1159472 [Scleroderma citrinum Foug A]
MGGVRTKSTFQARKVITTGYCEFPGLGWIGGIQGTINAQCKAQGMYVPHGTIILSSFYSATVAVCMLSGVIDQDRSTRAYQPLLLRWQTVAVRMPRVQLFLSATSKALEAGSLRMTASGVQGKPLTFVNDVTRGQMGLGPTTSPCFGPIGKRCPKSWVPYNPTKPVRRLMSRCTVGEKWQVHKWLYQGKRGRDQGITITLARARRRLVEIRLQT